MNFYFYFCRQLGLKETPKEIKKLVNIKNIKDVFCGGDFSFILLENGDVYATGNFFSELFFFFFEMKVLKIKIGENSYGQ